ncbi:hypothetical protein QYQ99_22285 [Comamonas testosteroni]|uniref:hypothetical protein n=1 Tax=Comamonas testosteroni TaxID=285 RepID=UPI00265E42B2|nr:hypothetical protein [Comamonas testosteroni]WKL15061.1 hypothetical protein QYQ99_22285 [Comamonas testosteroni]
MKETGLMFKAPLVRAILSGQKTQTRRIAKDVRHPDLGNWYAPGALVLEGEPQHVIHRACPWGQPGDRIYVRETWQGPLMSAKEWEDHYFSKADELPSKFKTPAYCKYAADGGAPPEFMTMDDDIVARWKPSIHMPKWAARIWLEVTGVRVERLQSISEEDAEAEGIGFLRTVPDADETLTSKQLFECLWDSTGGDWAANPWVWVIDFKRIEKPR